MSLSNFVLRSVNHCPIFNENPKDFDEVKLSTKKDVLLCCLHVRLQVGLESEINIEPASSRVARQVVRIPSFLQQISCLRAEAGKNFRGASFE
ncbi:hypothetical protein AVEN_230764-1 [Araneus ventricosus]|uniref:Uncharacterized protein n=1 Tax=Araneus ventricosus TaxID=182803 RepID=A0A4Y2A4B5_ARAVE|nr:hypothetical protein AVEN_230764-1 [Araneus ventricosus]